MSTYNSNTEETMRVVYDALDTFNTHDLGCSAALLCAGYALECLDKSNPRKALFVFTRKTGIDDHAEAYWSDQLQVPARSYFDTMKMLKNRLYGF